jgi:hypothetical protein
MESSQEILIEIVKKWVQTDNKIKQLNQMNRQLRQEKKKLNTEMIDIMKKHDIDIFNIKDGQIRYKKETKKEPLSSLRLLNILSKHPQLGEEQAVSLRDYVFQNREEVVMESIVRKINKKKEKDNPET